MDGLSRKQVTRRREPMVAMPKKVLRPGDVAHVEEIHHTPSAYPNHPGRTMVVKRLVVVPSHKDDRSAAPRRPKIAVGNGTALGEKPPRSDLPLTKMINLLPAPITKRKYFNDDELSAQYVVGGVDEIHDVVQQEEVSAEELSDAQHQGPSTSYIDVLADGSFSDFASGNGHLDGGSHSLSSHPHHSHDDRVVPLSQRSRAQPTQVRQLQSENLYLKDQLDMATFKNKQLEMLLLDRNARIRDLLKENLQTSVKLRKLMSRIGEETAEQLLAPTPMQPRNKRPRIIETVEKNVKID
ncbi:unnamed protein product, partial [Mesorhabditis belari]|uniref:Uncharacterized protein n=1 Tax=Mesorhabditis belari TaxID=2138241 RepID=A0AAF3FAB4_9BILA